MYLEHLCNSCKRDIDYPNWTTPIHSHWNGGKVNCSHCTYTIGEVKVDLLGELCLFSLFAEHSLLPRSLLGFVQSLQGNQASNGAPRLVKSHSHHIYPSCTGNPLSNNWTYCLEVSYGIGQGTLFNQNIHSFLKFLDDISRTEKKWWICLKSEK